MQKIWVAQVAGLKNWPQNIIVKAESEADVRNIIQEWLKKKRIKKLDSKSSEKVFRDFRSDDIKVMEALDLEKQMEIDLWLDDENCNLWKRHISEDR